MKPRENEEPVNKYSQARITRCKRRARRNRGVYVVNLAGANYRRANISRSGYVFRELRVGTLVPTGSTS